MRGRAVIFPVLLAALPVACTGTIPGPGAAAHAHEPGRVPDDDDPPPGLGGVGGTDELPPEVCAPGAPTLLELTPEQYRHVAEALAPGIDLTAAITLAPTFSRSGMFLQDATVRRMTEPHVKAIDETARAVARALLASDKFAHRCLASAGDAPCADRALRALLPVAFRRPAADDERARYAALFAELRTVGSADSAANGLLHAILMSPAFLFRSENGALAGRLDDWERASALSFTLTDRPPDAELTQAAAVGKLQDAGELAKQARRLLASADSAQAIKRFARELFRHDLVLATPKDAGKHPAFTQPVRDGLYQESERFITAALWDEGDDAIAALLAGKTSYANDAVATYLGLAERPGQDFAKVSLAGVPRAGLLTQGSVMASLAGANKTNLVQRGSFIRARVLCGEVPDPPKDLIVTPVEDDGKSTMRELVSQHSSDSRCRTCHELMDPIGFAFEVYDAAGAHRTTHNGKSIDTSAEIIGTENADGRFADALALVEHLAKADDVRGCMAEHVAAFVFARAGHALDPCLRESLRKSGAARAGNLRELFVTALSHDVFVTRAEEDVP